LYLGTKNILKRATFCFFLSLLYQ